MKGLFLLSALMIILLSNARAQREVTGRVTDSRDGSPVPAASIQVKGKGRGTSTNQDGRFRISAEAADVLVVSSVGFLAKEVTATSTQLDIILQFDEQSVLREVVVTGYTVQS